MPVALVTGSGGLIGSEAARHFARQGFDVIGVDNDMRAYFFGEEASTAKVSAEQMKTQRNWYQKKNGKPSSSGSVLA